MEIEKCSIGLFKNETCSDEIFIDCKYFCNEDRIALNYRSGTVVHFICSKHDKRYRINYTLNQYSCADPYKIHDSQVRKSLKPVSFELFKKCEVSVPSIIPGSKLCISCTKKVYSELPIDQKSEVQASVNVDISGPVESVSEDLGINPSETSATLDQDEPLLFTQRLVDEKMSSNLSNLQLSCVTTSTSEICSSTSETFTPNEVHLDRLNSVAKIFNLSPTKKKEVERSKTYAERKYYNMKSKLE